MTRKIVLLLGVPGSGKGTQAKLVSAHLGLPHVSTGDILRAAVAEGSELGKQAESIMESGALITDDLMRDIVRERIAKPDCQGGLVLDGYPRTVRQARDLEEILVGDAIKLCAILIEVSEEQLRRRIVGRRSCPACGKVFNIYESPSARGERCDACGDVLVQRKDDRDEVVTERLEVYAQQTEPLVVYYKRLGLLRVVNGERDIEAIRKDLIGIVNSL